MLHSPPIQNTIPNHVMFTPPLPSPSITKIPSSNQTPQSSSSINTQPIPRPTSLRPIPRTRIPTLAIRHLSRGIGKAIPTITLIRILGAKNLIPLTQPRAPLNRKRIIVVIFILDDSRGGGISVAACIAPSGHIARARGTLGLVFEERETVAGPADFGGVAGAFHVAFCFAFGGGGGGVGELVAAVAFGAVLGAEVGVA